MGIIFRQSLKSTIYSTVGAVIGFLTVGILMTTYLTPAEIGVRMQIQSYATIISSFLAFGIPQSIIRMFPHFKNKENKNFGILTLIFAVIAINTVLFVFIFYFLGSTVLEQDLANSPLFNQYYQLIIPFTIANLVFMILDNYATAQKESTIGVFLKDVALRVFILAALVLFIYSDSFDFGNFIHSYTYIQFIPVLLIIAFLAIKRLFPLTSKISFPSLKIKSELISVSLFSWVNVLSGVAIVSIDTIMLSKFTNSTQVGIYSILFFFAGLMLIPIKSMGKIANSVIADHFKENNIKAIHSIFKQSALNPFIMGLFLFGNIILVIPFIFNIILKNGYSSGLWVLVFLAISNLIKMSTGIKFIIISNSKYYRWTTIFLSLFVVMLILSNLIFIPKFGINGAAFASLISSLVYQVGGVIFIKIKFDIWPFSQVFLKLTGAFLLIFGVLFFIPNFEIPEMMSVIKSFVFSVLFLGFVFITKSSPELTTQINNLKSKLF